MTPAAFQAEFVNVKNVPSRKVLQVIFEVPVESSSQALDALGGIPHPGQSVRVAIARLAVAKVEKPDTRTSQRAALLCRSGRFGRWLTDEEYPDENTVATAMRKRLGVQSRSELDTNPEARARFEQLEAEYKEAMK